MGLRSLHFLRRWGFEPIPFRTLDLQTQRRLGHSGFGRDGLRKRTLGLHSCLQVLTLIAEPRNGELFRRNDGDGQPESADRQLLAWLRR